MVSEVQDRNRFSKKIKPIAKPTITEEILNELIKIIGDKQWVSTDIEVLYNYSQDMGEQIAPTLYEVAVLPNSTEEVSLIVKLANKHKFAVTPYAAGANVGGLTLPHEGGLVMDFKRMNRCLQIDKTNKFIVIEPGFTFGHLKKMFLKGGELEGFRYSFPFSPPYTSVLTNALLNGLGSLGVLHGCANNFISGIEVVLPTGEIVNIGQNAINKGKYWIAREPLPDFTGIFIMTQGTMGIVTKMGLHVVEPPKYSVNYAVIPKDTYEFLKDWVHELDHLHVCDEIGIGVFPAQTAHGIVPEDMIKLMGDLAGLVRKGSWAKFLNKIGWSFMKVITLGQPFPLIKFLAKAHLLPLPDIPKEEPLTIAGCTISAQDKGIFKAKVKAFQKLLKKKACLVIQPKEFGELAPVFNSILDLPTQLPALYDIRGGGLTWVGSYVPPTNVADGCREGEKILQELGFFPVVVLRPMKSDHYFVLRFIIAFDSSNIQQVENARIAVDKVADVILKVGGTPYKMSPPVAKKVWSIADPEFYNLIARVKDLLDPNAILNPGKLLINGTPNHPYKLKDLTGGKQ